MIGKRHVTDERTGEERVERIKGRGRSPERIAKQAAHAAKVERAKQAKRDDYLAELAELVKLSPALVGTMLHQGRCTEADARASGWKPRSERGKK